MDEEKRKKMKVSSVAMSEWDALYVNHISSIESDHHYIENMIYDVFIDSCGFDGLQSHPHKDEIALRLGKFIKRIRYLYHDVPYHSFVHSSHVFLSVAVMLKHIQSSPKKWDNKQNTRVFTNVEGIALLVSALVHDVDHHGVFNSTLVKEGHEYSKLYNDQSVAENRSITITFNELGKIDNNFIDLMLDSAEVIIFRKLVIDIILSTDVADVDRKAIFDTKIVSLYKHIDTKINSVDDILTYNKETSPYRLGLDEDNSDSEKSSELSSRYMDMLNDPKARCAILVLIMQLSDIASSTQGLAGMKIWVARFIDEQMVAFKKGRKQNAVEVGSFYTGQKLYLSATTGLINLLKYTEVCSDSWMDVMTSNIKENFEYWDEFGEADTKRWLGYHWTVV